MILALKYFTLKIGNDQVVEVLFPGKRIRDLFKFNKFYKISTKR